jgi:hypothetical protein
MSLMYSDNQQFDAFLPRLEKAVRISGLYDAQVFTRRWIIRDKDPELKALLRCLNKVRSAEMARHALRDFKSALASRGLLVGVQSEISRECVGSGQ